MLSGIQTSRPIKFSTIDKASLNINPIIKVENNNSLLMITVPYEKGWNIYVDGKKADYEEVYDTFIGINLDKGDHEIKMVFYSPGFSIGCAITFISFSFTYLG